MKRINQLLLSLVMVITCISFVACGDDDDDNEFSTSDIVGKWKEADENGYYLLYTFNSEGKYSEVEWRGNEAMEREEWNNYYIEGNFLYLGYKEEDGEGYEMFKIKTLNKEKLIIEELEDEEDGYTLTL